MSEVVEGIVFFVMIIFFLFLLAFMSIYGSSEQMDKHCLNEYAKSVCEEKGMENLKERQSNSKFICREQLDARSNPSQKLHDFYFLEEEKDDCRTKESFSFKEIGK